MWQHYHLKLIWGKSSISSWAVSTRAHLCQHYHIKMDSGNITISRWAAATLSPQVELAGATLSSQVELWQHYHLKLVVTLYHFPNIPLVYQDYNFHKSMQRTQGCRAVIDCRDLGSNWSERSAGAAMGYLAGTINGLFFLSTSSAWVTFLPEGLTVVFRNFAWGFKSEKIRFGLGKKNLGPHQGSTF